MGTGEFGCPHGGVAGRRVGERSFGSGSSGSGPNKPGGSSAGVREELWGDQSVLSSTLPQDDANDVTAQVFAVAWRRSDSMPQGDRTLPWLYGVARNEVRTSRRAARRLKNLHSKLGGQAAYPSPGPETVVVRHFEQEQILEALATPRPDDQEILRLRAYEHLTLPEIAVVLDCSVEAAKKRSSRAMKRLRKATDWTEPHDAGQASTALEEGCTG
jgi:RNA polymerase sigma-70 factor (ECF subfamily)